jgi:hypothetical protein
MKKPTARDIRLLTIYGIVEAENDAVLTFQGGVCYVCERPPANNRLSVDHDHKTGLFRGLVCWDCNRALQLLRDSERRAYRAHCYLSMPPAVQALRGDTPAEDGKRTGRDGRATRKWRTKREKRERMAWVVARLEELGYEVPKRLRRDTEVK